MVSNGVLNILSMFKNILSNIYKTFDLATRNIINNTSFFQLQKYEKKYKKYYKKRIFVLVLSFKMIICLSIHAKHIFLDNLKEKK